MRFLISVLDDRSNSALPGEMEAIDAFNDRLREHGHLILACGLHDPSTAKVFDHRGDANDVTDGPHALLSEFVSGFWLIDVPNYTMAQHIAAAGSKACNRKVELRQLH